MQTTQSRADSVKDWIRDDIVARGLAAAGADFLAVSAGVWRHAGGPAAAVEALNREIALGLTER